MRPPSNVAVALSGGVDSAMAAVLLRSAGWEVYGLHFVLSEVAPRREERVREIADQIGIPLEMIDLRERFESRVVGPFCDAYLRGLTPNPCIRCNEEIKFEALYHYCIEKEIPYLATGHYVRMDVRDGRTGLKRGVDIGKDQSYFLQRLGRDPLSRAVFPLGEMTKEEVRARAHHMALPCHSRPESQEICFISGMDYREFVETRRDVIVRKRGLIVDADGEPVGEHEGVYRYTIGQRHGLGIASSRPYYVKEIRPDVNQVVVARREALFTTVLEARHVHWIQGPPPKSHARMMAQVRYRHRAAPGSLEVLSSDEVRFTFDTPQWAVTPGQALALYDGEGLIGGGWIRRPMKGAGHEA
jgi:tRNA-specific 2-thiouridylase